LNVLFQTKKSLIGKHLEPNLIAKVANLGNFKTVILTHMYPMIYGKEGKIENTIKKIAKCKVQFAYDFKEIIL